MAQLNQDVENMLKSLKGAELAALLDFVLANRDPAQIVDNADDGKKLDEDDRPH